MDSLRSKVDPDGLLEYSVVFTDRSLNHMSKRFQAVMRGISATLERTYHAEAVAIVPGGGTYGMEAVARQFAGGNRVLVLRNGWFSYRWTQIFEMGAIPSESTVLKARRVRSEPKSPFEPAPLGEALSAIRDRIPAVVFAPHVETSSGIMLPETYIREVADATHSLGGLFVLDCVASGAIWVDMESTGVDVLITAPQKGWTSSPCAALVMFSRLARERIESTASSSFSCDLKKWLQITQAYEAGGHAYHATMPTDSLAGLRDVMAETEVYGLDKLTAAQNDLGTRVRSLLESRGFQSVAAEGFKAPGVVVSYTDDEGISSGSKFIAAGLQTASGVPLMCDEPADFRTFRIGLFGLDKLRNVERTIAALENALNQLS